MTTLKETLRADLDRSLRAGDELRKSTLRLVLSEIQNQEKAGKTAQEFDDAQVRALLQKESRKRNASAEEYAGAGRQERADRELAEAAVIDEYLPQPLTETDVDAIVDQAVSDTGATGMRDMGRVMKQVVAAVDGRYDGKAVSEKVRARLA